MREGGRVVPRTVIVRELWGSSRDTKSLDVPGRRLRGRLAAIEGRRRIVTVRGVGFRFLPDEELGSVDRLSNGGEHTRGLDLDEIELREIDLGESCSRSA